MKIRAFLLRVALLLPTLTVQAAGLPEIDSWDIDHLHDDYSLSALLEQDVLSLTDQPMGHLRDVLISNEGRFVAAVVEFAASDGAPGFALARMEWSNASIAPEEDQLTISLGANEEQDSAQFNFNGEPASKLIGRSVSLADNPDFGTVADILVDRQTEQPSAFLVAHGDGVYALPVNVNLSKRSGGIGYPYASSEVEKTRLADEEGSQRETQR